MATSKNTREVLAHQEWLDYLQPVGLVVSPIALVDRGVILDESQASLRALQERLREVLDERPRTVDKARNVTPQAWLASSAAKVLREFLRWPDASLLGGSDIDERYGQYIVKLAEYDEELRPTYVVVDPYAKRETNEPAKVIALVMELPEGTEFDRVATASSGAKWSASPEQRFERLLRETEVPIGIIANKSSLRLVYRPALEAPGHVTFPWRFLMETAGRPALSALSLLLSAERVFAGGAIKSDAKLLPLLEQSREAQNAVSVKLAKQVFAALEQLLQGFEAADRAREHKLLGPYLDSVEGRETLYGGLLTVMLRLVFLLYAEDRKLLGGTTLYDKGYALWTLWDELSTDYARAPELLESRYGAWGRIIALSRLVHDGGAHGVMRVPARKSSLFAPDTFPFLEGRTEALRSDQTAVELPRISDLVIFKILQGLVFLEDERLSYSALGVEQLGSVYEAMMGYTLERATGQAVPLGDARVVVTALALKDVRGDQRAAAIKKETGVKLNDAARKALASAKNEAQIVEALTKHKPSGVPLAAGRLFLQPGEARRKSGTHYTPRALTVPIVERTLRPVLQRLGANPTPEQILSLRVCDPAMGSGAFLVAACRMLAEELERSWATHGAPPELSRDEPARFHAARLVAQRCLYGVDVNAFAVELGRLSLWLETLAGEHDFTFVDHALRSGDSLVGLTRAQLCALDWAPKKQVDTIEGEVRRAVDEAITERRKIHGHAGEDATEDKREWLAKAEGDTALVRAMGDAVIAAWFDAANARERQTRLTELRELVVKRGLDGAATELRLRARGLRARNPAVRPFHWELEFPEVFSGANPGFDAIVGNPPFAGKNTIQRGHAAGYIPWLQETHPESHGNADLVAHFFRRAFNLLRKDGCAGLVATNTIAQGDTRNAGLRWICTRGGVIYRALRRYVWPVPGAAVVTSIVHFAKGDVAPVSCVLDGRRVEQITAFLFHDGGHEDPETLHANAEKSFQGAIVLGLGFTFDDTTREATPIAEMERLIAADPRNQERIFPYLGGEELNTSPTQSHHRYVINFGQLDENDARVWPDLLEIVRTKVKPERDRLGSNADARRRKSHWWMWGRDTPALDEARSRLPRVFANSQVSSHLVFAEQPTGRVFAHTLNIFAFDKYAAFGILQSRIHEVWARFFASSLEDRLRYTPSSCFQTFPFPPHWEANATLERVGAEYHAFRAKLMADTETRAELMDELPPEGLTATYNRFHDRRDVHEGIVKLRAMHAALDRAVLEAYGWWNELSARSDWGYEYRDVHAVVSEDDEDAASEEAEDGDALPEPTSGRGGAKQRYGFSEGVRDEILARLLKLNAERAEEERVAAKKKRDEDEKEKREKRDAEAAARAREASKEPLALSGEGEPKAKRAKAPRAKKKG